MKRSLANCWKAFLLLVIGGLLSPAPAGKHAQEAVQWLSKAVALFDREDYGGAKTALQMALQVESNFSEAYILKALLEYRDGQLDKSQASLRRALELNPRLPQQMRKNLEQRAKVIESGLTQQDFSHFRLQFHGAERRDDAWQAVKYLDEAYNDLGSRFGIFPEARFPVVIFTSSEFWEAWNAPVWLGGFFDTRDGRIRVRMDPPPGGEPEFRRRLRHEFTHAYLHALYPRELPVWFQEGVAQFYAYAGSDSFWKENRLEELRRSMKNAPWMDLDRVEHAIQKKDTHPGLIYLAYLEAEALVLYIAKQRGDSWIPAVFERLRNGASFKAAVEDVVGVAPRSMLEQVRRSL